MDIAEQHDDNAWDHTDTESRIVQSCDSISENHIASSFIEVIHDRLNDDVPVALKVSSITEVSTDTHILPVHGS